jgi:hypothetical protein
MTARSAPATRLGILIPVTVVLMFLLLLVAAAQPPGSDAAAAPAVVVRDGDGALNFFTGKNDEQGALARTFSITPEGSLIAGGVSRADTPLTNVPPVVAPAEYDNSDHGERRRWIHDFYFGRYETPGEGQPRLHLRGLIMWGRGDSPDIQLGRAGPDNAETAYGPPEDTEPGTSLGKFIFTAWGQGAFQGDIAGIYARNDAVPTGEKNPGSLHLGTAGESERGNAWRDMIDRLVISSRGYVGIGDEFPNPAERLHVKGNVLAEGNVAATGDVTAGGAKKFNIAHPTRPGRRLVHAAVEGPEAGVYYRGEARLTRGRAVVELPEYFEALARPDGRTVHLTNVDGFDRLAVQTHSGAQVRDGSFVVVSDNPNSSQAFSWEVKAVRADVSALEVER